MGKKRRIVEAKIRFISLCKRGANGLRTIYKASQDDPNKGTVAFTGYTAPLAKFEERGEIVCCVYPPNRVDSQDEWAGSEDIRKMAHDFLANKGDVDMMHDEKALEGASVAESFIIQKSDPRFADMKDDEGKAADVAGGWGMVIKLHTEELRKKYREGDFGGVSMGGTGLMREEDPPNDEITKLLSDIVKDNAAGDQTGNEEIDMDAKEMKSLLDEALDAKLKPVNERLVKLEKAAETVDDDNTVDDDLDDIDWTDEQEVNKHLFEQAVEESKETISKAKGAKAKAAAAKKHAETVKKLRKQFDISDDSDDTVDDDETGKRSVNGAEVEVAKSGFDTSVDDDIAYGEALGKIANAENGRGEYSAQEIAKANETVRGIRKFHVV